MASIILRQDDNIIRQDYPFYNLCFNFLWLHLSDIRKWKTQFTYSVKSVTIIFNNDSLNSSTNHIYTFHIAHFAQKIFSIIR